MISHNITVLSPYAYPNKCTEHDHDMIMMYIMYNLSKTINYSSKIFPT